MHADRAFDGATANAERTLLRVVDARTISTPGFQRAARNIDFGAVMTRFSIASNRIVATRDGATRNVSNDIFFCILRNRANNKDAGFGSVN